MILAFWITYLSCSLARFLSFKTFHSIVGDPLALPYWCPGIHDFSLLFACGRSSVPPSTVVWKFSSNARLISFVSPSRLMRSFLGLVRPTKPTCCRALFTGTSPPWINCQPMRQLTIGITLGIISSSWLALVCPSKAGEIWLPQRAILISQDLLHF